MDWHCFEDPDPNNMYTFRSVGIRIKDLFSCSASEDPVQQEGHGADPDGGGPAGHPRHQPSGQGQALGQGHQGHAQQAHQRPGTVDNSFMIRMRSMWIRQAPKIMQEDPAADKKKIQIFHIF